MHHKMSFKSIGQAKSSSSSLSLQSSTFLFSCLPTPSQASAAKASARSKAATASKYPAFSKSAVNLFKLVAIVAFIKYELINQQLVGCRPREGGLIYNRDGKFIYRAPKSRDGFIIVIDDRQRESLTNGGGGVSSIGDETISRHASKGNRQLTLELPKIGAESYPQMQILRPRVHHTHESAVAAAAAAHLAAGNQMINNRAAEAEGDAANFYPGGQLQLINLAELQANMGHPHPHHLTSAAEAGTRSQLVRASGAMVPAGLPPGSLQMVPLVQLYQPSVMSRINTDGFGGNHMLSAGNDGGTSVSDAAASFHQSHQQMFGADAPIGTYDYPATPMEQQSIDSPFGAGEAAYLPPSGLRTGKGFSETNSGSSAAAPEVRRFNLVDYGHLLDAHGSRVEFQNDQGIDMMRNSRNNKPGSLSDLIPLPLSSEKLPRDGSRAKPNAEASVKHPKYSKGPSAKPKANELRRMTEVLMTLNQDEMDPISGLRNSSYWKQFRDQYGIME